MNERKPRVLCTISGIFPFDFFPDSLIIDEEKITIVYREFPFHRKLYTLYYSSIMSVTIEMGLFLATMQVLLSKSFAEKQPDPINFVGKTQAEYARKLIMGLIRLHELKYDFANKTAEEIIVSATNEGTDYLDLS